MLSLSLVYDNSNDDHLSFSPRAHIPASLPPSLLPPSYQVPTETPPMPSLSSFSPSSSLKPSFLPFQNPDKKYYVVSPPPSPLPQSIPPLPPPLIFLLPLPPPLPLPPSPYLKPLLKKRHQLLGDRKREHQLGANHNQLRRQPLKECPKPLVLHKVGQNTRARGLVAEITLLDARLDDILGREGREGG